MDKQRPCFPSDPVYTIYSLLNSFSLEFQRDSLTFNFSHCLLDYNISDYYPKYFCRLFFLTKLKHTSQTQFKNVKHSPLHQCTGEKLYFSVSKFKYKFFQMFCEIIIDCDFDMFRGRHSQSVSQSVRYIDTSFSQSSVNT